MAAPKQIELGKFLSPLTDLAMRTLLAGTLKKNVIRHFTNKGLPFEAAENITACGAIKADNYKFSKSK